MDRGDGSVESRETRPPSSHRPPDRIFSPGCEEAAPSLAADAFATRTLATHLYHLESRSVSISWDNAFGGSIEPLCNDLLVVTPWGRIALVRLYGMVVYLPEGRVPMNLEGLKPHPGAAAFSPENFRVADILLKQVSEDHWELFVTHHYFAGKCVRFRLSSTAVLRQGASVIRPGCRTDVWLCSPTMATFTSCPSPRSTATCSHGSCNPCTR